MLSRYIKSIIQITGRAAKLVHNSIKCGCYGAACKDTYNGSDQSHDEHGARIVALVFVHRRILPERPCDNHNNINDRNSQQYEHQQILPDRHDGTGTGSSGLPVIRLGRSIGLWLWSAVIGGWLRIVV